MKKLVMIIGLPGSGKTSLAKGVAEKYSNAPCFSTEEIRAKLFSISCETTDCDFTEDQQNKTYRKMSEMVRNSIMDNDIVICEGVFRSKQQRKLFELIALENNLRLYKFYIHCEDEIERKRLIERKRNNTISPSGVKTYEAIKEIFEYPSKKENYTIIDNSGNLKQALNAIINTINKGC